MTSLTNATTQKPKAAFLRHSTFGSGVASVSFMVKNIKHEHGTPNPIMQSEEEAMFAKIDKALHSSGNAQTIGRAGELPLLQFFDRHLPNTLKVKSDHFVTPDGYLSPQIDIMVLDSRYPLLSENEDGSVLAMLHSVIHCIEVKTNIRSSDLKKIWKNSRTLQLLFKEVFRYATDFENIGNSAIAYRSNVRLETLEDNYFDIFKTIEGYTDLTLLRIPEKDQIGEHRVGMEFHLEPDYDDDTGGIPVNFIPMVIPKYTPLSDYYYQLVQNSYYNLSSREFDFAKIGSHINKYMSWSTALSYYHNEN